MKNRKLILIASAIIVLVFIILYIKNLNKILKLFKNDLDFLDISWLLLSKNSQIPNKARLIAQGLREELDVSWYANPEFDKYQMCEIYNGLKGGIDVSVFANPKFDAKQMKQIRGGLEEGIDVSIYADPIISANKMYDIYLNYI